MEDAKSEIEARNVELEALKEARIRRDEAKANKDALLARFQESPEWIAQSSAHSFATSEVESLEALIKDNVLNMHGASMELPDRVAVKMFTVVEIPDELKAKEWCIAHFTPALKLDSKVFEKAAKDGNIPAELATVSKEARAQIATKL